MLVPRVVVNNVQQRGLMGLGALSIAGIPPCSYRVLLLSRKCRSAGGHRHSYIYQGRSNFRRLLHLTLLPSRRPPLRTVRPLHDRPTDPPVFGVRPLHDRPTDRPSSGGDPAGPPLEVESYCYRHVDTRPRSPPDGVDQPKRYLLTHCKVGPRPTFQTMRSCAAPSLVGSYGAPLDDAPHCLPRSSVSRAPRISTARGIFTRGQLCASVT